MRRNLGLLFILFSLFVKINFLYAQWVQTSLPDSSVVSCFATMGTNLFAGTRAFRGPSSPDEYSGGVFGSTDNGTIWTAVDSGFPPFMDIWAIAVSGTNLFAGSSGHGAFLSTNNGMSWTAVDSGIVGNPYVAAYALAVSGRNLFAATVNGVFLSTNNGTSWSEADSGLPINAFTAFAVKGTDLFAGGDNGGVFLSTNNGAYWTEVDSGLNNGTWTIGVSGTNLYAATGINMINGQGLYVYRSTNNGTTWNAVDSGLIHADCFADAGGNIFAAAYGVYLSTDNGTTWSSVGSGLPLYHEVLALAVCGSNLFAGTEGAGVWKRPLSEMLAVKENKTETPSMFSLSQNYPNPFNPTTTISFSLPSQSYVSLKVFDLLGREVSTIVSEELRPGNYIRQWNAAKIASGVYLYRFAAGSHIETKKLMLIN
jgi:hypothetical protein